MSLFFKSPSCYKFMRNQLNFVLPSVDSIRSWMRVYNLQTGIDNNLFLKLQRKTATMESNEKQCVLLFDEMSIKRGVEYNSNYDKVEGYEDLGSFGRSSKHGTQAMVFMVRGLLHQWKIPVGYFITSGSLKSCILKDIIKQVIFNLEKIGLCVRAITCDQDSNNRATFNYLGVTPEIPYFFLGCKKIIALFDVPHLIKSLRNTLMNHNIYIDDKIISWADVCKLYEIDQLSSKAKSLCKITEEHIKPNSFQKMKVKLATQIFSNRVSAAMKTAIATGQLKNPTAPNTAQFIKDINDLFDALNSKRLHDANPNACALSTTKPKVVELLEKSLQWIPKFKTFLKTGKENTKTHCFKGLIQTINGILLLWKNMHDDGNEFLLTSRLNQDPIENLFATIRQKCGCNNNPTSRQFRIALQQNIFMRLLIRPDEPNCEMDEDNSIILETTSIILSEDKCAPTETDEETETEVLPSTTFEDVQKCLPRITLESCAIYYFAGYCAYISKKKYNCTICADEFTTSSTILENENLLLTIYRDYDNSLQMPKFLQMPSQNFLNVVKLQLEVFESYFDHLKYKTKLKEKLKDLIIHQINQSYPDWLSTPNEDCRDHRIKNVEHLLRVKINYSLKWESQKFKQTKKRKLQILQHL